jgi:hypothetical protein
LGDAVHRGRARRAVRRSWITPIADALIVLTNGRKASKALGIHGVTAALLVAAGLVLAVA